MMRHPPPNASQVPLPGIVFPTELISEALGLGLGHIRSSEMELFVIRSLLTTGSLALGWNKAGNCLRRTHRGILEDRENMRRPGSLPTPILIELG